MATAESQFSFAFGDPDAELDDDALIRQWSAAEGQWAAVGSDHLLVHIAKHTPLVEKTEEGAFNVDRNLVSHVLGRAAAIGGIGNLSANLMLSDRLLTNILEKMVTEGRMRHGHIEAGEALGEGADLPRRTGRRVLRPLRHAGGRDRPRRGPELRSLAGPH